MNRQPLAADRYIVERRLGHGGMATVYLARDEKLGRQVAVKVLADNLAGDDDFRERFMREAQLAARLSHANVVQVFDVGEDDDERPYIVMEYVDGHSVADLLKRGRSLPPEKAVPLLAQVVAGLEHAHQAGLVHRDVKPANLLLRARDGRLKIADFGIARAFEETRHTRTGRALGTAPYMAPEQLEGQDPTPATDVYSCGVVAWEMLTGRTPHDGGSPSSIARSQRVRRPSLRRSATVPPELESLVRRCLRPRPRDRFRDAGELGEALAGLKLDSGGAAATVPLKEPAGEERDVTAETARLPGTTATRRLFRRPPSGRVMALAGAAVIAIVGLAVALGSDDPQLFGGADNPRPARERVEPAPQLRDSAAQARALADWIRDQSR